MRTRIASIGKSRGVRLTAALIEQAGLKGVVEVRLEGRSIVITPFEKPRDGWAADAKRLGNSQGRRVLDDPLETRFDREEWEW